MWYVGMDVHLKSSSVCVLDEHGHRVVQKMVRGPWPKLDEQAARPLFRTGPPPGATHRSNRSSRERQSPAGPSRGHRDSHNAWISFLGSRPSLVGRWCSSACLTSPQGKILYFDLTGSRTVGIMVAMVFRATTRDRGTFALGRLVSLLSLLPLLVFQPLGGLGVVLHDHDDCDHSHLLSTEQIAQFMLGESRWHAEHYGDIEPGHPVPQHCDQAGPLETDGSPDTLIVLRDSDACRVHVRGSTVQATQLVANVDAPCWQISAFRDVEQWSSPSPRGENHCYSGRAGVAAVLLRNHALLL